MKIDDLLNLWTSDSKIDELELSRESLNIPALHAKYLKIYADESLKLKQLYQSRKKLQLTLSEYYKGEKNNPEDLEELDRDPWEKKIIKQDVASYVDSDDDMILINSKIAYREEVVDAAREIVKAVNMRGYAIKNSIEFLRFTNGG